MASKDEAIKYISENPEITYEFICELLQRSSGLGVKQGKYPWDYPENRHLFEIRDKRTGNVFPLGD